MRKEDAKKQIRKLWLQRPKSGRTSPDALIFFEILQKTHPELLRFRSKIDKYQTVKTFISDLIEQQ